MALSETATIRINADTGDARALFQAIGDGFDRLEKKTERVNRRTKSLGDTVGGMARSYISWQAAINLVTSSLQRHNAELDRAAQKSRELEEIANRLAVQGNLTKTSDPAILNRLGAIAKRNATSLEATGAAATQLISSGFDTTDVLEGKTTDAFLQGLHALNASGQDTNPRELAMAVASFMTGSGQQKTAGNLAATMTAVHNLFRTTNVQAADLQALGGKAAPLATLGRMTPNEILAAFSVLKDVGPAAPAATSMASLVSRLAGGSENKEVQDALKAMGLSSGDVDFVGERFTDVIGRIGGGLQTLPEGRRAGVARKLIGQENLDDFFVLLNRRQEVIDRQRGLGDRSSFEAAVTRRTSGLIAEETRAQVAEDLSVRQEGITRRQNEVYMQDANRELRDMGVPSIVREILRRGNQAFEFVAPDVYNAGATTGGRPAKVEVEFVAPTGSRVPGTMQRKQLNSGY